MVCNNIFDIYSKTKSESDAQHCKGLIFQADVSCCPTRKGIGFFVRLNLLKRKSCPGCIRCAALYDAIGDVDNDWMPIGIESVEHGKLYRLEICNASRDWETGIIDDWDIKLVEFKE